MINLEEILIVNITGAVLLMVLPFLRMKRLAQGLMDERLFHGMTVITFAALLIEIVTFLIDGQQGPFFRMLAYLCNGYLFMASAGVGMLWVMYVDYNIYHNWNRIKQRMIPLVLPFACVVAALICDLFGAGIIYEITLDNIYVRGRFVYLSYAVMFLYFFVSIALAIRAILKNGHILFPIHYFVLPCVLATLIQGMQYGITLGWFGASLAFLFSQMQAQNRKAYVDDLSGLYNRRYYNYYIEKMVRSEKCRRLSGIMMDGNDFKQINDSFGHRMGDDAIVTLAKLLTQATTENSIVFHLSGDEFAILSPNLGERETQQLVENIQQTLDAFNKRGEKPYQLSLAIGALVQDTAHFNTDEFANQLDMKMYASKAEYYLHANRDRHRSYQV